MTEQLGASAEVSGETPESGAPDEVNQAGEVEDLAPAPDSGSDEGPAAGEFPAVVDARPAAVVTDGGTIRRQRTMVEPDERVRDVLWGARYLVVTRYMWPTRGVPRHQQLSAWAVVLRLEAELIRRFQSPLPGLWERWDAGRRRQEMSLRVDRLRDVEREQEKPHLRRLAFWLLTSEIGAGRRSRLSGGSPMTTRQRRFWSCSTSLLNLSDGRRFLVLRPPPGLPARPFG